MSVYRDDRNGQWRYRCRVTLPDGRRHRISGTPKTDTKKAAEHAERMHILQLENPSIVPAAPATPAKEVPTISAYIETFLASNEHRGKPRHRADAKRILARDIEPILGHLRLDEVTQEHVDALAAAQTCGPKTLNNKLSHLSSMLRYAARCRLIEMPDCRFFVRDVSPRSDEICSVPDADVEAILGAARDQRYRVAILLGRDAGLRAGEIRGLQWGDVDEVNRRLTVRRSIGTDDSITSPKNGKARPVPMSDALRAALRDIPRRGLWIVSRLDGESLSYWQLRDEVRELYGAAKVPTPAQPLHGLRHSFCSALADAGVPVQVIKELAGHASIQTTMKYLHADDEARRAAIAKAFGQPVANKPTPKTKTARKPQRSPSRK